MEDERQPIPTPEPEHVPAPAPDVHAVPPPILPPPPLPTQYQYQAAPAKPGRPVVATLIGIVLLVFAAFVLTNFRHQYFPESLQIISNIFSIMVLILDVVCGVGLLMLAPWARKSTIVMLATQGVLYVVLDVVKMPYAITMLKQNTHSLPESTMSIVVTTTIVATVIGMLFMLAIYGAMIYGLTRRDMVAAYEGKNGA